MELEVDDSDLLADLRAGLLDLQRDGKQRKGCERSRAGWMKKVERVEEG